MDTVELACIFVRAEGDRLLAAERLVLALPHVLGDALDGCDLAFASSTRFLAVAVAARGGAASEAARARLAFWTARAGGRLLAPADAPDAERERLRAQVDACDVVAEGILPGDLLDVSGRFFGEAGAPAGRHRSAAAHPVLCMDVGGPGWQGVQCDPKAGTLFVAAPIAPPPGDVLALALRLPGVARPVEARATVMDVRGPAQARPGAPAGYTLRLDEAPPALRDALARKAAGASEVGAGTRATARFAVSGPVTVVALPPPDPAAQARIEYATASELASDWIENLSQGGAFVRTARPAKVGAQLVLRLALPNGVELSTPARVVFASASGMGVRFTLDAEADAVLSAAVAQLSGRPRRALVVDDDALLRRMLADALGGRGFEVLTAADATEGLRVLAEEVLALDLLVTDVRMPGMDGAELVRRIRTVGGEADLAIVAVTGRLEEGLEPRLAAAGADAVLDKALGVERIAQAADAVVERRRSAPGGAPAY
ncbi:response regulator [Anaeromyxobacter sp. Red801]|uniref:response regulator n=1 Tax=Anaeromyxobacter sp. Red801 TaxID=3411632 RepID=UPI003B9F1DD1